MVFDPLALTYDADFTHTRTARTLRARVHERLIRLFAPGAHVLELGSGTGEDALFLAARGVRVTATDASAGMLGVLRAKTAHEPLIHVVPLDLCAPALPDDSRTFDGVLSNFGALNVLDNVRPLAGWLAQRVKPGGRLAFGVMARFCLWELLWHGAHGDWRTALRRFGGSADFRGTPIYYPTVRAFTRAFAPAFRRAHVEGLGLALPPSDVYGALETRPRLWETLHWVETKVARGAWGADFADHFWIELQRVT